jgi:hypothetical protein
MQNPTKWERRSANRAEGTESTGLLLKPETTLQTEKAKPETGHRWSQWKNLYSLKSMQSTNQEPNLAGTHDSREIPVQTKRDRD